MAEVFVGGLPREARRLQAVEMGLHAALLAFAGGTSDPTRVKLRMHTKSSHGEGLGFAFAWMPDEQTAERLVEATEIYFVCDGVRTRAGIRAARGRSDSRPPPACAPGRLQLTVALLATFDASSVVAGFDSWRRRLGVFGLGLELQMLSEAGGAIDTLERVHADVLLLLYRSSDLSESDVRLWARCARALGEAGRAVLLVEAPDSALATAALSFEEAIAELAIESGGVSRVDVWSASELRSLYPAVDGTGAWAAVSIHVYVGQRPSIIDSREREGYSHDACRLTCRNTKRIPEGSNTSALRYTRNESG